MTQYISLNASQQRARISIILFELSSCYQHQHVIFRLLFTIQTISDAFV